MAIWRRMQPADYDWLPLLFWIVPSIVTWGVVNNMLENTQAIHGPLGRRDTALLRDLDALGLAMPRGAIIGACQQVRSLRDWDMHSYVQRFYRVSLDGRGVPINGWLLQADGACTPPPACMIAARGDSLALFRCSRAAR